MARIKVTPETLLRYSGQTERCADGLLDISRSLQSALASLDWETRQQYDVEGQAARAFRLAQSLSFQSERMASFLRQRAQAFVQADQAGRTILSKLQPLPSIYPSMPMPLAGGGLLIPIALVGVSVPVIMAAISMLPSLGKLPQWAQDRIRSLFPEEQEPPKPKTGFLHKGALEPDNPPEQRTGVIPQSWLEDEPQKPKEPAASPTAEVSAPKATSSSPKAPEIPASPPQASTSTYYDVPIKSQGKLWGGYACSPTSASMVLDYYHNLDSTNRTATPQELINSLDPGDGVSGRGMSLSDMTDELNDLGYHNIVEKVDASTGDLKEQLGNGPVIAIVGLGNINHAIVVKGISTDGTVVANDPLGGVERTYSTVTFETMWAKASHSLYAIRP